MGMGGMQTGSWNDWLTELDGLKEHCKANGQDWVMCMGGMEGAGKSTLAIKTAKQLDPDFDLDKQIVNDLHDYIQVTKELRDTPYKAIVFDEAVNAFFSRSAMEATNKILVKLFILNRSLQHFHILTIPSVFYLDKYLREFRIKTFTYSWMDWGNKDQRFFAVYHRKKYKNLVMGGKKANMALMDKDVLTKRFKPNFIAPFTNLDKETWNAYEEIKHDFQDLLFDEAEQEAIKQKTQRMVGFSNDTPLPEFLRWLLSKYGHSEGNRVLLHFTQEQARIDAASNMNTIHYLIRKIISSRLIKKIGRSQYVLTDKGGQALKPEDEKEEKD